MTPEQLAHLAKIRELAAIKKRELKERDTKARNLAKEELELKAKQYDKIQEEKQKLNKLDEKPKEPKKKVKEIVKEESSDEEDGNDSESDNEAVVQKKPVKQKPRKITDIDDENIHKIAYETSQHKLLEKVMSNRI